MTADRPRVLCNARALTSAPPAAGGAAWRLAESGRQLDANVVRLAPGERIGTHAEPDLDVLLLVLAGDGTIGTEDGPRRLSDGTLLWLPHGSSRSLTAGDDGLSYLTVHRRRPGLQIQTRSPEAPSTASEPATSHASNSTSPPQD